MKLSHVAVIPNRGSLEIWDLGLKTEKGKHYVAELTANRPLSFLVKRKPFQADPLKSGAELEKIAMELF